MNTLDVTDPFILGFICKPCPEHDHARISKYVVFKSDAEVKQLYFKLVVDVPLTVLGSQLVCNLTQVQKSLDDLKVKILLFRFLLFVGLHGCFIICLGVEWI